MQCNDMILFVKILWSEDCKEIFVSRMTIMSLWVVSMEKNNTLSRQRQLNTDGILEIFHYSLRLSILFILETNLFFIFLFFCQFRPTLGTERNSERREKLFAEWLNFPINFIPHGEKMVWSDKNLTWYLIRTSWPNYHYWFSSNLKYISATILQYM